MRTYIQDHILFAGCILIAITLIAWGLWRFLPPDRCCPAHAASIKRILDRHQHLQDDTMDRYDRLSESLQSITDQLASDKARAEDRAKSIENDVAKVRDQLKRTQTAVWRLSCPGGVCR